MRNVLKCLLVLSMGLGAVFRVTAGTLPVVPEQKVAEVKKLVADVFPRVTVDRVLPTSSPDLFLAADGVEMVYVDPVHHLILMGPAVDVTHHQNVSDHYKRLIVKDIFSKADLSGALKEVHGTGKHILYVFEDPYCKYCRELVHQLAALKDVTIYTVITPILKSESYTMAHKIVCHSDPLRAWTLWMTRYQEPSVSKGDAETCMVDGLKKNIHLAEQLGITSVPTIIFESGEMVSGVLTTADLQTHLS